MSAVPSLFLIPSIVYHRSWFLCGPLYYSVAQSTVSLFIQGCTDSLCTTNRDLQGNRFVPDETVTSWSGSWASPPKPCRIGKTRQDGEPDSPRHSATSDSFGRTLAKEKPTPPRRCRRLFAAAYSMSTGSPYSRLITSAWAYSSYAMQGQAKWHTALLCILDET